MKDKIFAALAYIFWVPSLYIVLTEKKREGFIVSHAEQALLLWIYIFLIFFALRFLINLLWSVFYIPYLELTEVLAGAGLWGYAVYCGYRSSLGLSFKIPH